ncbi:MAG: hypothetical protein [Bacteriophage sp.]|nr:MAG: hypothetical protein [Bacteriophage sp.]
MMAKYVYRYRDTNRVGDGASLLYVERRVVIKETDHFVYHAPLPYDWDKNPTMDDSMIAFCLKTKGWNRARRTKKDANRSAWRLDQKVALADWLARKAHHVSRMRLALERVESLIDTCIREGVIVPETGGLSPYKRVIEAPDTIDGPITPEAESYNWMEY